MAIAVNETILNPAERQILSGLHEFGPSYPWLDIRERTENDSRFGLTLIRIGRVGLRGIKGEVQPYMIECPVPEDEQIKLQYSHHRYSGFLEGNRLCLREGALRPDNIDTIKTGMNTVRDTIRADNNLSAAQEVAKAGNGLARALVRIRLSDNDPVTSDQLAQGGIDIATLVNALSNQNLAVINAAELTLLDMGVKTVEIGGMGFHELPGMAAYRSAAHQKSLLGNDRLSPFLEDGQDSDTEISKQRSLIA